MKKLAILDDYQNVAMEMADWTPLDGDVEITVFNDHLSDEDAVAGRLKDFEIVMVMRERNAVSALTYREASQSGTHCQQRHAEPVRSISTRRRKTASSAPARRRWDTPRRSLPGG